MRHSLMVKKLAKPGKEILREFCVPKAEVVHMTMGISGEAGELLDAIKKWVIYNKTLDRINIVEELGDLEFYMEGLRQCLGISRKETLAANISKLSLRYKDFKYTDTRAHERADKQ